EVPIAGQGSTYFFQEYARRHGDYAVVGLAARAVVAAGRFSDLRLGFFAVGERPLLATAAAKLINASVTPALLAEAATALADELEPQEDQQAS
ncbi:hypothetical protein, partial [Escherichia coli]